MTEMQRQFEEWYSKEGLNVDALRLKKYACWQAWQASRAAIVVKLPDSVWSNLQDDEVMTSESVKRALDAAGVAYK